MTDAGRIKLLDDACKKMTDAELETMRDTQVASGENHQAAVREILRRKKLEDRALSQGQRRIEIYTLIILILTGFLAVVALRDCLH